MTAVAFLSTAKRFQTNLALGLRVKRRQAELVDQSQLAQLVCSYHSHQVDERLVVAPPEFSHEKVAQRAVAFAVWFVVVDSNEL